MYITQSLHAQLQRDPDQVATVFGDRTRTVRESVDRIARLAGALRSLGVAEGDRVGIYGLNSDRYHELLMAVPWAGAMVNPVNVRWSPAEVAYSFNDCQTNVLFVDDTFAPACCGRRCPTCVRSFTSARRRRPRACSPTSNWSPITSRSRMRAAVAMRSTASSTPAARPVSPRA